MNKKKLLQLGVPHECVGQAILALQSASNSPLKAKPKQLIPQILAAPQIYLNDPAYGDFARSVIAAHERDAVTPTLTPISFPEWGTQLDEASRKQMRNACRLPVARAAALMPDAHVGYGIPIGGVLACENAVIPFAVGVDIACRMKLTITDLPVELVDKNDPRKCEELDQALEKGTCFGAGKEWKKPYQHPVLDEDWSITAVTREMRDRAVKQLGTSGSGNHFVEWGIVELPDDDLGLKSGKYVALLSHSGSRGTGARVCDRYSDIARRQIPRSFQDDPDLRHLAWLSLDSEAGQEYWAAMNLMGLYASANHEVIHRNVTKLAGAESLLTIENHHNFAWKETHGGNEWIVHRKGATPASAGALGIIPGNMADAAFIVRGKGEPLSLNSAAHGAGRRMSRTKAKSEFNWKMWKDFLNRRRVRVLAASIDEAPGAYKDIHEVMAAQSDLVDTVATFHPRIVMMCGDGSPAED